MVQVVGTRKMTPEELEARRKRNAARRQKEQEEKPAGALPDPQEERIGELQNKPGVFRDVGRGDVSGLEVDGRTFLGINKREAQEIIDARRRRQETPLGAVEIATRGEEIQRQRAIQEQFNPFIEQEVERLKEPLNLDPSPDVSEGDVLEGDVSVGSSVPSLLSVQGIGNVLSGKSVTVGNTEISTGLGDVPGVSADAVPFGGASLGAAGAGRVLGSRVGAKVLQKSKAAVGKIAELSTAIFVAQAGTGATELFTGRGKLDESLDAVQELDSMSQALRSLAESGGKPGVDLAFTQLQESSEQLADLEAAIATQGARNPSFRLTNEYQSAMAKIRSTRIEIINAAQEVRNIASQGEPTLDPEQLVLLLDTLQQLERR